MNQSQLNMLNECITWADTVTSTNFLEWHRYSTMALRGVDTGRPTEMDRFEQLSEMFNVSNRETSLAGLEVDVARMVAEGKEILEDARDHAASEVKGQS